MISVGVNPPKTPVTEGSMDMAPATLPNICKMPGPPAPFVPTPLPNFGRSADRLKKPTTTVKIQGKKIAIKGSYYMSQPSPDVASQGTGGGIVSAKTQGKTEFVAPGSMNVKAEGKNIQLLGDGMTNNGGSPANSGTIPGNQQPPVPPGVIVLECEAGWSDCQKKQMKGKAAAMDAVAKQKGPLPTRGTKDLRDIAAGWQKKYARDWNRAAPKGWPPSRNPANQPTQFYDDCAATTDPLGNGMEADHIQEVQLGGNVGGPFRWLDREVNGSSGRQIKSARAAGNTAPTGFTTKNC